MTPREFVLHWHREAMLAAPRFVPDSWERVADGLMRKGVTADDLTLVARWMRTQLGRSQNGERNSVSFNASSFRWTLMMGEWGASNEGVRFAELLSLAEAARKPAARAVQKPCAPTARMATDEERAEGARRLREFQERMQGGAQ